MTTVGGAAGRRPRHAARGRRSARASAAPADRRLRPGATRSTAGAAAARVAVLLPLAALVFAVTVLAVKAWPAIRVNGW